MASPPTGFLAGKSVWQVRQPVFWPENPYGRSANRFLARKIRVGGPPRGFLAEKSVWELRQEVFWPKNPYGSSANRFFGSKNPYGRSANRFFDSKNPYGGSAKWLFGSGNPYGGPANRFYRAYSLMKYLERNSQFSWMIAFPRSRLLRLLVCASASMPFSIISFSI